MRSAGRRRRLALRQEHAPPRRIRRACATRPPRRAPRLRARGRRASSPTTSAPGPSSSSTDRRAARARAGPLPLPPRTAAFLDARWEELRALPACGAAAEELGAGAAAVAASARDARRAGRARAAGDARAPLRGRHQLRLPRGALRARVRGGGATLYRDAVARARGGAAAPACGIETRRGGPGRGLSLVRGDCVDAPARGGLAGGRRERRAGGALRARARRAADDRHPGVPRPRSASGGS